MRVLYCFFLLMLPFATLRAESLAGNCSCHSDPEITSRQYRLKGFDPELNETYTGTVTITKEGKFYTAFWAFDDGEVNIGKGLRKNNVLSFTYIDTANPPGVIGLQVYEIENDFHELKGPWITIGGTLVGTESLHEIH